MRMRRYALCALFRYLFIRFFMLLYGRIYLRQFGNVEDSYRGPQVVLTYPVSFRPAHLAEKEGSDGGEGGEGARAEASVSTTTSTSTPAGSGAAGSASPRVVPRGSVRVVAVTEEDVRQALFSHDALPLSAYT
jgi:hypothetical protein